MKKENKCEYCIHWYSWKHRSKYPKSPHCIYFEFKVWPCKTHFITPADYYKAKSSRGVRDETQMESH